MAKTTRKKTTTKTKTTTKKATPKKASAGADRPGRVFAIRVTDKELAAIHKAAGPRNATRFVRAVAAAFAGGDEKAFRAVLKEAREARA